MDEGRFWWEQQSAYWDIPFYADFGLTELPDRDDALAAREQLWAMRELWDEGDFGLSTDLTENKNNGEIE